LLVDVTLNEDTIEHIQDRREDTSCLPFQGEGDKYGHVLTDDDIRPPRNETSDSYMTPSDEPIIIGRDMLLSILTVLDSMKLFLDLMETKNRKQLEMIRTAQSLATKAHESLSKYVPPGKYQE
jgi:Xaa-Pro aminopeptidase